MSAADRPSLRARVAPPARDLALAAVLAAVFGVAAAAMSASLGEGDPWWTGVLIAVEFVPLAWRRRAPLTALVATLALGWAVAAVPATPVGLLVAALVASYTVASHRRWVVAVASGLVAAVASPLVVLELLASPFPFQITVVPQPMHVANGLVGGLVAFGGAVALGASVRMRRAYTASVEAHAARLERERAERERRAVLEERARIARELHDLAAHHLSGLVLQAGALERTVTRDPQHAQALAGDVRQGGAQALTSMRRLVGLLRADDDEAAGRGSQPTLADLEGLVERARAEGLDVTLTSGAGEPLPAVRDQLTDEVELAVFRVVQEALSNARRHAPGAHVDVSVQRDDERLLVAVVDDGARRTPSSPSGEDAGGHGLIGMRERVGLLGGTLEVGPRQPRGWRVRAGIPLDPQETR